MRWWWVFVLVLLIAPRAWGAELLLRWTTSGSADAYHLYDAKISRQYTHRVDLGASAVPVANGIVLHHLPALASDRSYIFAVTASNAAGESDFSNEKAVTASDLRRIPPAANAGPDRSGTLSQTFSLGMPPAAGVIYAWFQNVGPPAFLSSPTQSSVSFRPSLAGTYRFTLVAADERGIAASDSVVVNVASPTATATRPPATAGTPTLSGTMTRTATPTATPTHGETGDRDGDSVIDALDNCPRAANQNQRDTDRDGIGDACDHCRGGFTISNARLRMVDLDRPSSEHGFLFVAELLTPDGLTGVDSAARGLRLVLEDLGSADNPIVLADVGPGAPPNACGEKDGWDTGRDGARYEFVTNTDALPNRSGTGCRGRGSANGLYKVTTTRTMDGVRVTAKARDGTYTVRGPIRATIVFEAGQLSPAAVEGRCGTMVFSMEAEGPSSCRVRRQGGNVARLRCSLEDEGASSRRVGAR